MGVREYTPGDSLRRIPLEGQRAHRGLQVKLFEFTTDLKVAVFLAVDSFAELPRDDLEFGISTAASIAQHLLERNVQTGLLPTPSWLTPATRHASRQAAAPLTLHTFWRHLPRPPQMRMDPSSISST